MLVIVPGYSLVQEETNLGGNMFRRLWLFRISIRRLVLFLFIGIAIGTGTISGVDWFTAKSKAVTTGGKPTEPENLPTTLVLSDSQTASIKIETLGNHHFRIEKECVGSIDFDEDLAVQVFTPYQGKITTALAQVGDDVQKGQPLYTIDSPDLVQAESTLIGAAATLDLTNAELGRAKQLYSTSRGVAQRELEQATSDQQTAEGALKAARDAVRVYGKTEAEIDRIVMARQIDSSLVVLSPITGQITARNAQAGLLAQPGNTPAPYAVADVSRKWMLANVAESDSPVIHVGQPVEVTVMAYPGRVFVGKISTLGATIDPTSHRVTVRSEILDPDHELRPGMFAAFSIEIHEPVEALSIPVNGVVREGDGTMTAWVSTDPHHFVQRTVKLGLEKDNRYQVLEGLRSGESVVTDGAIFLDNMLTPVEPD
jgi:membrane fusion protein, heavy metal efflux system